MKKIILAWALFLAPASTVPGQQSAPADTGTVATPSPESTPADTSAVVTPPPQNVPADTAAAPSPADTGAVAPPRQESPPADTGAVVTPPSQNVPADTGAVPPPPADTGAVPPQPADTGTVVPQEKITPAEPGTVPPLQQSAPTETAAAPEEEPVLPQESKPNRVGLGIVFNDEAPLSMRAWFNPKVGLDVGVGLKGRRVDDLTDSIQPPQRRTTLLDLSFDLGVPVRVIRKEKVDFIVRPGFGFRTRPDFFVEPADPDVRSVESSVELEINGSVGFEYYPSEKASFSLFTGIALVADRPGGSGNTILRVESFPKKGTNFTFRYYLF